MIFYTSRCHRKTSPVTNGNTRSEGLRSEHCKHSLVSALHSVTISQSIRGISVASESWPELKFSLGRCAMLIKTSHRLNTKKRWIRYVPEYLNPTTYNCSAEFAIFLLFYFINFIPYRNIFFRYIPHTLSRYPIFFLSFIYQITRTQNIFLFFFFSFWLKMQLFFKNFSLLSAQKLYFRCFFFFRGDRFDRPGWYPPCYRHFFHAYNLPILCFFSLFFRPIFRSRKV